MDFFYWLCLAVFIYYVVMFLMLIISDSDIATTFASKFGTSLGIYIFFGKGYI